MKYYSEKLQKLYDSAEDLEKAEKLENERVKKEEALKKERSVRVKEVEDAFKKANELLKKFNKDYGPYTSITPFEDFFDVLFRM